MDDGDEIGNEIATKAKVVFSSDISKSLQEVSEFDVNFTSNLELLKNLRRLLVQCLQICEGAYRAKPTQGNSYALTNMVAQIRDITDRLEESINYNDVANAVATEVVQPFIEKMILDLGSIIANEIDDYSKSERKLINKAVNQIYRKFGAKIETKMQPLQKKVVEKMLEIIN